MIDDLDPRRHLRAVGRGFATVSVGVLLAAGFPGPGALVREGAVPAAPPVPSVAPAPAVFLEGGSTGGLRGSDGAGAGADAGADALYRLLAADASPGPAAASAAGVGQGGPGAAGPGAAGPGTVNSEAAAPEAAGAAGPGVGSLPEAEVVARVETGASGVEWLFRTSAGGGLIRVTGAARRGVDPPADDEMAYLTRAGGEVVLVQGGRRYLVVEAPWSVRQHDSKGGSR